MEVAEMKNNYNPKDKFTAKQGDFEILYMPNKKQGGKKNESKKTPKKK